MPAFLGARLPDWVRRALDDDLAGICLYGHNLTVSSGRDAEPEETARRRVARLTAEVLASRPDALTALDEEGGDVTRLDYLTGSSYPGNLALGVLNDLALTRRIATLIGQDLRSCGVKVNFAPSVDVNSDPFNPVIGVRSFGADTDLVAAHGVAYVTGMQSVGVAATAKHFPGHGATVADSHLALPVIDVDEQTFRRRDLPPFRAAIEAGVELVMTSHVVFSAMDSRPATLSRRVVIDLLRHELGFDGVIVTDALDMAGVRAAHGVAEAAALSLAAGADLLLTGAEDGQAHRHDIVDAVERHLLDGTLAESRLVDAATRVGRLRNRLTVDASAPPSRDGAAVGRAAARRAILGRHVVPLGGPADVIELRAEANLAVGQAPWSLAQALDRRGLLARLVTVTESGPDAAAVLQGSASRPLVVVTRDAYRSPWQRSWLRELFGRRSATLVAIGMPDDLELWQGPAIATYGAGRANLEAAAALLGSD